MRILILVDCYLPNTKSGAKHIHDLAVAFRDLGHATTILTPAEGVPQAVQITQEHGIEVVRVAAGRVKHPIRALRAWREIRLSHRLWVRAQSFFQENGFELIVFYSPTIFFGDLVRRLKRLWRCPAYLILRDIFPEWALNAGALRKGPAYWFFRRKEILQYSVSDVIGVQSPANLEYFQKYFPRRYTLEVLFNWANLHESGLPLTNFRSALGLENKVVFFYGGNMGVAQDMSNIVRLAAGLADQSNVHFLLVGDGSEAASLQRSIFARGLRNIHVLPAVDQRTYLAMVAEFDIGLISLDRRLSTHNVPGKMLSYMYWGKPILASTNAGNDLFDMIEAYQTGFCLVNGEDEKLLAAARRLAQDADVRSCLGKNSRQLLEKVFSAHQAAQQVVRRFAQDHFSPPLEAASSCAAASEVAQGDLSL